MSIVYVDANVVAVGAPAVYADSAYVVAMLLKVLCMQILHMLLQCYYWCCVCRFCIYCCNVAIGTECVCRFCICCCNVVKGAVYSDSAYVVAMLL